MDHFKSRIEQVCNTAEISDYFESKNRNPADSGACYSLESALDLKSSEITKEADTIAYSLII